MDKLQKYIKEITGIELSLKPVSKKELDKLPLYMRSNLKVGEISGKEIIFDFNSELTPDQCKKQFEIIEKNTSKHVVFVFNNLEAYNRKRLMQRQIGFIVPGRQMYIPKLFIDIKDYGSTERKKVEKLFPAAQCLLFYYILGKEIIGLNFKSIALKLNYGTMTITRVANVLANLNFCRIEGRKEKSLVFVNSRKQIWDEAQPLLTNPIDKEIYIDDKCESDFIYKAGINALAHYTEISEVSKKIYAVSYEMSKNLLNTGKIKPVKSRDAATTLQVWKYDPGILASGNIVDPLSLFVTLKDNNNERVQGELHKLIETLW